MIQAMTEADALALAMLAVLAVAFGCVLLILVAIYRRGKSADDEVQKLIEEVADEERAAEKAGPADRKPSREPWEREADWWKG
jgi:hypothetical protein